MNKIEQGNGRPRPRKTQGKSRPSQKNTKRKKKRKSKKNNDMLIILKAFIVAVIGVVIIALIITGVKGFFIKEEEIVEEESSASSSILGETESEEMVEAGRVEAQATPEPSPAPELDISNLTITQYGDMVTVGNVGYDYYKFDLDTADSFIDTLNESISKITSDVNIYTMIVPSAVDIMLPLSFLEDNADLTSDQEKTIDYINSKITGDVTNIELYATLKSYSDQKIYYNTDNRITSLGGYAIYSQFCYYTGVEVEDISNYSTGSVSGFLGNIYSFIGSSAVSTAEEIVFYIPNAEVTMDGDESLFADVSDKSATEKYSVFLGGSSAMKTITNASLTDNSCAVIIGDSTSNTIVPYIAQNYQTLYFLDYRYYEDSLADFVEENNVEDLIYCFNIQATNSTSLVEKID